MTPQLRLRTRIEFALIGLAAALGVITVLYGLSALWAFYAGFTAIGWAIGLPVVLAAPERVILRAPWLVVLLAAALLGPTVLLVIFVGSTYVQALSGGIVSKEAFTFTGREFLFRTASLCSLAAVATYVGLCRSKAAQ